MKMKNKNIVKPSETEIARYVQMWYSEENKNYIEQESALKKLFLITYPNNIDLDDVLIKVCSLNDFYSTHIFSPFAVAKHIISLDIDRKIKQGDLGIVNKIAMVKMNGVQKNFYSFATKYCSHHYPNLYPIYDSYVGKILLHFKKEDSFCEFGKIDLKEYTKFKNILLSFRTFYNLEIFTLKDIDRYLWLAGKEHFRKTY
ncbi:MAG: hypothetical protein J0M08_05380 [Bacteroidetes bacterium]|nr:hypothetical protein [Bacteroidota bacterium]